MLFPNFKEVDVHEDIEKIAKENDDNQWELYHLKGSQIYI